MGELERGDLYGHNSVNRMDYKSLGEAISDWDIMEARAKPVAFDFYKSAPSMGRKPCYGFS